MNNIVMSLAQMDAMLLDQKTSGDSYKVRGFGPVERREDGCCRFFLA